MKRLCYTVAMAIIPMLYACEEGMDDELGGSYYESGSEYDYTDEVGDQYVFNGENPFIKTEDETVSTFSIDADGASYANVRRFILQDNATPPNGAVRTEELINYFDLDYPFENTEHPISISGEISACPWNSTHKLLRVGIQGQDLDLTGVLSNYVFLIDVSGSMGAEDKLDLLKNGFIRLLDELNPQDRIAIVTYAGSAGVLLESTPVSQKSTIVDAINKLGAGGATAGAEGIVTAYDIASENFIDGGNNRIILGSDGDFNVGISNQDELVALMEKKRESGIYVTVLGVGRGNLNDAAMEQMANNGNGTYEYIDNIEQLKKVFIYDKSKFYTVAKDVKVQLTFDPNHVEEYRLIGYENRNLNNEDFEDDDEDAGEIGAGQNITALYQLKLKDVAHFISPSVQVDFRYKLPDSEESTLIEHSIVDVANSFEEASDQMRFAASVASFGMNLINSEYKGESSYGQISEWLNSTNLPDEHGFKAEFKEIVRRADKL